MRVHDEQRGENSGEQVGEPGGRHGNSASLVANEDPVVRGHWGLCGESPRHSWAALLLLLLLLLLRWNTTQLNAVDEGGEGRGGKGTDRGKEGLTRTI